MDCADFCSFKSWHSGVGWGHVHVCIGMIPVFYATNLQKRRFLLIKLLNTQGYMKSRMSILLKIQCFNLLYYCIMYLFRAFWYNLNFFFMIIVETTITDKTKRVPQCLRYYGFMEENVKIFLLFYFVHIFNMHMTLQSWFLLRWAKWPKGL